MKSNNGCLFTWFRWWSYIIKICFIIYQALIKIYRIEEAKRAIKRPIEERFEDIDRKRSVTDRERRFEAPPPPRFDSSIRSYDRSIEKKRDDYHGSTKGNSMSEISSTLISLAISNSMVLWYHMVLCASKTHRQKGPQ